MTELDEEFSNCVNEINDGKDDFTNAEQDIINSWVEKLSEPQETEESKIIRNRYCCLLAKYVTKNKKLVPPFTEPPDGDLLLSKLGQKKISFQIKLPPCRPKSSQGPRPATREKRTNRSLSPVDSYETNEFEDPEEMVKAITRSKGQSFAEFVVSISRHTADFGQELRRAMKVETSSFREYVDNVLTQRIKDLTEVLNEEQNRELQKIKTDIDKWQVELAHVKRRIEEMIPEFDLDEYKKDKNYLKKMFTIKPELSEEDSFKKWKEENTHRLKWISDKICKTVRCNEQTMQEISNIRCDTSNLEAKETVKQQNCIAQINCEISEYKNLQSERNKLLKENNELLAQLKELCN